MVAAGGDFSVVLKDDGTVWSFGTNELSELGSGEVCTSSKPTRVLGLDEIVAVDCAGSSVLALKKDGTVWGWGFNDQYGLGNGVPLQCCYPVKISGVSDVKALQAGNGISLFLKNDGTVWYYCDLDTGASDIKQYKGLKDIIQIAFQNSKGLALTKDGEVWSIGIEYKDDKSVVITPNKVNIANVKKIDVGDYSYIAQKKDNSLWLWGINSYGQIGNGTKNDCNSPTQLKLKNVKLFATGLYFSMAVLSDGSYYAWGDNGSGQLGNNTQKNSLTKPVKIKGLSNVISMDGGYNHTVVLESDGDVMAMGYNEDGVLGVGGGKNRLIPCKVMNIYDQKYNASDDSSIYPNGSLEDWGSIAPVAVGTASALNKLKGIKILYAMTDQQNLYLVAALSSNIPASVNFCLDTDNDKKKEYQINFRSNNYPDVAIYKGNTRLGENKVTYFGVYSNNLIEIKVSLWSLGYPDSIKINAEYGADKKKYGINSEITSWKEVPEASKEN